MANFEKETRHQFFVFFINKQQLTQQNVSQQCTHDAFCQLTQAWCVNCPLTVLLHCPITSMMCTLPVSARACVSQSCSRILLSSWLREKLHLFLLSLSYRVITYLYQVSSQMATVQICRYIDLHLEPGHYPNHSQGCIHNHNLCDLEPWWSYLFHLRDHVL